MTPDRRRADAEEDDEDGERETWLCRSTVGAASDMGDHEDADNLEHEKEKENEQENCREAEGGNQGDHHSSGKPTCSRPLDLGGHLFFARRHALKQRLPTPTAMTTTSTPGHHHHAADKKRRNSINSGSKKKAAKTSQLVEHDTRKHKKKHGDQLPVYMHYERERRVVRMEPFHIQRTAGVKAALFLSTACVHCVSFNVSPALRRVFRIDALPVGLCIVLAWTLLGVVNCVGAFTGRGVDRIALLRRLAWLWIAAIVLLQLAKVLPVAVAIAHAMVAAGYVGAVIAHGVSVPHLVAIGTHVTSASVTRRLQQPQNARSPQREQHTVDAAMGAFFTRAFAAVLMASSLVQAYYFAAVDLEIAGQGLLVIRSRRSIFVTIPCGLLLLCLLVAFLFQSRHHGPCEQDAELKTPSSAPPVVDAMATGLDRKLAQGDLEWNAVDGHATAPVHVGVRSWLRLGRHSFALAVLAAFTLTLLLAVGASLVSHATPATSTIAHLAVSASLFVAWCMTTLLSAGQLSPASRDKVYKNNETLVAKLLLPSRQQLFVLTALVCLASVSTFAAFVRAQLYSTLFIQTCQLHRPSSLLFDPNLLGAWIGLASSLCLPLVRCLRLGRLCHRPRVSAIRCVAVAVLLYLLAIFVASVVELYRRDTKVSTSLENTPVSGGCLKTRASDLSVLWSLPHLVLLAMAEALFRLGAAEEAYALTASLDWLGVAQGVLAMADCVGYTLALSLSSTLAAWLFRAQTSDLVLLLLMVAAVASLLYALTKRLADHVEASRRLQLQQLPRGGEDGEDEHLATSSSPQSPPR